MKKYVFSLNHTSNLEFWSFPRLVIGSKILSSDTGWLQPAAAFHQSCDHIYSTLFSSSVWILCFQNYHVYESSPLSFHEVSDIVLYNRLCVRKFCPSVGTFFCPMCFAHVKGKLWCSEIQCNKCIFNLQYFQLIVDLSKCNPIKSWILVGHGGVNLKSYCSRRLSLSEILSHNKMFLKGWGM